MRYYVQVVSEALLADPPLIRGYIEDNTVRRLISFEGEGRDRVFTFDIVGEIDFATLIQDKDSVAFSDIEGLTPLDIRRVKPGLGVHCPQCWLSMTGEEFWEHYNLFHARRPFWLNKEHWSRMVIGPYVDPPEQK